MTSDARGSPALRQTSGEWLQTDAGLVRFAIAVTQAYWVILVFPAWVFLVSAYILVTHLQGRQPTDAVTGQASRAR